MGPQKYRVALLERLGNDGYDALEGIMDERQKELLTVDRFERRLTEEAAARHQDIGAVRLEIGGVRLEIAGVRQDIGTTRFELLKWMFLFWVGHTVTVAGIVGAMLRFTRP